MINLKRAYDPANSVDGTLLLIERLWPRGVKKTSLKIKSWRKDVAPSTELRKWFNHDPARWKEFQDRYIAELKDRGDAVHLLREKAKEGTVTLVYAAHDEEHNGALVLKRVLEQHKRS